MLKQATTISDSSMDRPPSLKQQLLRAMRGAMLLKMAALVIAMLSSIVMARALGPEQLGTYAFVFSVVTLLGLPAKVGLPSLLVRETSKSQAQGNWSAMRGLWRWATRVILVSSLVIATLAGLILYWWRGNFDTETMTTMAWGLLLVPLVALGNARGAVLRGLRLIVRGLMPEYLIRPLLLLLLIVALWLFAGSVSASQAMGLHVLASLTAFSIGAAILWRNRPRQLIAATPDLTSTSDWWRAAIPLALLGGIQIVNGQTGILILGMFHPKAEVGLLKVAVSGASLAGFGLQMVNLVLGPYISRLYAQRDMVRLQRLAGVGSALSGAFTLPFFLAFVLMGGWVVDLLFGAEYAEAVVPLAILGFGQMASGLFGSVGLMLTMTGHERTMARLLAVSTLSNILLCLLLAPWLGVIGAALASTGGLVIANVAMWLATWRRLNIDASFVSALRTAVVKP